MTFGHLAKDPVILVLAVASLVSWAVIVDRMIAVSKSRRGDTRYADGDHTADCPLRRLNEEVRRNPEVFRNDLMVILDSAIVVQRQKLEGLLPLLGVIGSTAPYVGLLGTVIGIIQAFHAIHMHNNMSPAVVSAGISTALVATATGLAVAIPAVAAHHLLNAAIARRAANWEEIASRWLQRQEEEFSNESVLQA